MQRFKFFTILLAALSLVFFLCLLVVINISKPEGLGIILAFYLLISGLAFSLSTLTGLQIRKYFGQRELQALYVKTAIRQGIWFVLLIDISLILLNQRLFSWLNAIFLVLALVFLESFLISKKIN